MHINQRYKRLARMISEIEADVESLKLYYLEPLKYLDNLGRKRGLADVIGYTSENIYVFYRVADVYACVIPIGIRLFIDIP